MKETSKKVAQTDHFGQKAIKDLMHLLTEGVCKVLAVGPHKGGHGQCQQPIIVFAKMGK